jgi:FHA domain
VPRLSGQRGFHQASIDLQEASAEAVVDPGAAKSIRALLDALGSYEALAAQVTLVSGQGNQIPGKPSPTTLALYTKATDLLRAQLLPASQDLTKRHFALNGSQLLIGRRSRSRGIEPDIDLTGPPEDPGVSHTHALLVANPDGGWSLVDIESANGTYIHIDGQYKRIEANQPVPLKDGDQIFLGAWTTLTLRSRFNKRRGIPR